MGEHSDIEQLKRVGKNYLDNEASAVGILGGSNTAEAFVNHYQSG
jgi:hypothetical protein